VFDGVGIAAMMFFWLFHLAFIKIFSECIKFVLSRITTKEAAVRHS
jgi:hypothetical protein